MCTFCVLVCPYLKPLVFLDSSPAPLLCLEKYFIHLNQYGEGSLRNLRKRTNFSVLSLSLSLRPYCDLCRCFHCQNYFTAFPLVRPLHWLGSSSHDALELKLYSNRSHETNSHEDSKFETILHCLPVLLLA